MTRIAASPYSMWRDIAITNKQSIAEALLKLEQRLGHIRENLDTRALEVRVRAGTWAEEPFTTETQSHREVLKNKTLCHSEAPQAKRNLLFSRPQQTASSFTGQALPRFLCGGACPERSRRVSLW